jgi:hypothetical protein
LKPQASSCGRGIKVISKDNVDSISATKKAVVQKYIEKPHLINSRKYDLRIYVLVTSCDPLRIYFYEKGLVRFCANKYSTKHLKSKFAHLTNYSINKKSDNFIEPGEIEEENEEVIPYNVNIYLLHISYLILNYTQSYGLFLFYLFSVLPVTFHHTSSQFIYVMGFYLFIFHFVFFSI